MMPPLSAPQRITIYRKRYPDGLVCNKCGRLLATRPETYSRSNLTETARLSYVCCECLLDRAEAERIHEVRVEKARHAAKASVAARRLRALEEKEVDINPLPVGVPISEAQPVCNPAVYAAFDSGFLSTRSPKIASARRGGRPRKHPNARAARTAAQRAWRARERLMANAVLAKV